MTTFPSQVDVLTNPAPDNSLNNPSHASQHINANDAIEAIEGYLLKEFTDLGSGTLALALSDYFNVQVTPTATGTFTTTVPASGTRCTIKILTSGVTSYTMTFGSGFRSQGTLATGTTTSRHFMLHFISDGTTLNELSRTTAMA